MKAFAPLAATLSCIIMIAPGCSKRESLTYCEIPLYNTDRSEIVFSSNLDRASYEDASIILDWQSNILLEYSFNSRVPIILAGKASPERMPLNEGKLLAIRSLTNAGGYIYTITDASERFITSRSWFDNDGYLTKFEIQNGEAVFISCGDSKISILNIL